MTLPHAFPLLRFFAIFVANVFPAISCQNARLLAAKVRSRLRIRSPVVGQHEIEATCPDELGHSRGNRRWLATVRCCGRHSKFKWSPPDNIARFCPPMTRMSANKTRELAQFLIRAYSRHSRAENLRPENRDVFHLSLTLGRCELSRRCYTPMHLIGLLSRTEA